MRRLRYPISLPERLVRASSSSVGGVLLEGTLVLLPEAVRRSQLYQALIGRWLRIVVEYVGGVEGFQPADDMPAGSLTARKVTGNVLELSGIVAVGWSPVWVLAAASDLSNASKAYLEALVEEFQRQGLLAEDSQLGSVDELLDALGRSMADFARILDIPPLTLDQVRATLAETRSSLSMLRSGAQGVADREDLDAVAEQLQRVAEREGVSMWRLSMLLGFGALQAGATVTRVHILDYYRTALTEILEGDLTAYVRRVSRPYLSKTMDHLDPRQPSHTDRLLDRVSRRRLGRPTGTTVVADVTAAAPAAAESRTASALTVTPTPSPAAA